MPGINPLTGMPYPAQTGPTFAGQMPAGTPPTGLIGAEQALTSSADSALAALRSGRNASVAEMQHARNQGVSGLRSATDASVSGLQQAGRQGISAINTGLNSATGYLDQAITGFDPMAQQGTDAGTMQAALSGALGPEALQQALNDMQPVNAFLQEQGERSVARNAAALGGLQGGNVMKELSRFGQGLASQNAQQQFANLGTVAGRGFDALSQQGAYRGQQGSAALQAGTDISRLGMQTAESAAQARMAGADSIAGMLQRSAEGTSQLRGQAASDIAQVFGGTGQQLAAGRTQAGNQIASSIGATTSALADLVNQQGAQQSATLGSAQSNLANLLAGSGASQAQSDQQLAALLANLATQQGSTVAGLGGIPGVQPVSGILSDLGSAASGIGTAMAASDNRLKTNITKVGQTAKGIGLYTWDWTKQALGIVGNQPTFGVIAQEIENVIPDAVIEGADGFKRVDYNKVVNHGAI